MSDDDDDKEPFWKSMDSITQRYFEEKEAESRRDLEAEAEADREEGLQKLMHIKDVIFDIGCSAVADEAHVEGKDVRMVVDALEDISTLGYGRKRADDD